MKVVKKVIVGALAGVVLITLLTAAYVVPILTTEIDPNTGKPQCPGGKDWDLPGSSCHYGIIVDYMLPALSEKAVREGIRRGDIVRWTSAPPKKKRGR